MKKVKEAGLTSGRCNREKRIKNDVFFSGDVCVIVLKNRQGMVVGTTMIDTVDHEKVKSHRWYLNNVGYAMTGTKIVPLAATILGIKTNRNVIVDHINQNKLDNRRINLRVIGKSENAFNSKQRTDNTSGYRGVSWDKARNKWTARICIHGKVSCIGRYGTIEKAIEARKLAEIREKELWKR